MSLERRTTDRETAGGPLGSPDFLRRDSPAEAKRVLIAGASARAAAHSALRAGWAPECIDLFGDADLQAVAPSRTIPFANYPQGLIELADQLSPGAWFYTGALENHPEVVAAISRTRPLLGNDARVLERARDPFLIAEILNKFGLPHLRVARTPAAPSDRRAWLVKPLRSAGGIGIQHGDRSPPLDPESAFYRQEFVEGVPHSAVVRVDAGRARLLGVTRQLIGDARHPFRWRGNVGPAPIGKPTAEPLAQIAAALARELNLDWLFGIDFILDPDTQLPYLVEINPRYTASVEVLERAYGRSLLSSASHDSLPQPTVHVGKVVVFAPCAGTIPLDAWRGIDLSSTWRENPAIADLPAPGSRFHAGAPVLSAFHEAQGFSDCLAGTLETENAWLDRLKTWATSTDTVETL